MNLTVLAGLIAVTFYAISSGLALRQLRQNKAPSRIRFLAFGWLAALSHAWCLWHLMVHPQGVALGILTVASAITFCGTVLVLISSLYRPLEWVSLMAFPVSILLLPPAMLVHTSYTSAPLAPGIAAHVIMSILAYAAMTIATCQSILIMLQHHQLKQGNLRGLPSRLPPIQTMETMLFELIWTGFILLTVAIALGLIYVDNLVTQHLVHQAVLTVIAWLIFAFLLTGRHFIGWRSITAGRLTIAGFIVLIVGFFGTQAIIDLVY